MGEFCDFFNFEFANVQNNGIFFIIGRGKLMSQAGVVSVKGGNSENNFLYRFFESVGRTLCGVTCDTFSTPTGSFFVPAVESWEKSQEKNSSQGGSTWTVPFCSHTTLSASITVCGGEL